VTLTINDGLDVCDCYHLKITISSPHLAYGQILALIICVLFLLQNLVTLFIRVKMI